MSTGNFICTADNPWKPGTTGPVVHPDAKEGKQRDGWPAGDEVEYSCPHCGHEWTVELPQ